MLRGLRKMGPRKDRTASTAQREQDTKKNKRRHLIKSILRYEAKTNADDFNQKTLFELEDWLTTLDQSWSDYKS